MTRVDPPFDGEQSQVDDPHPDGIDLNEDDLEPGNDAPAAPAPLVPAKRKISEATQATYLRYVKTLRKMVSRSLDDVYVNDIRPTDLADFLVNRASFLRPKTAINYRVGLMYWLDTLPQVSDVLHARLTLQLAFPKHGFKPARPDGRPDTLYSRKSVHPRTFSRAKFDKLLAELNRRSDPTLRRARRAHELMYWLQAGLASGLRPIEWETAQWEDKEAGVLRVVTAKRKLDNYALPNIAHLSPPPEPQVRLVPIDASDRIWVEQHLQSIRRHLLEGKSFSRYYENNRIFLYTVSREVFGPQVPPFTLYMLRGQFAANRKRRGVPQDEVSAIMGTSSENADAYYGKSRHAHRGKGVAGHRGGLVCSNRFGDSEHESAWPQESMVRQGTIVDATIIDAPSSTKNEARA